MKKTGIRTEVKWAIIFVAAMLLWMVLERLAGLHGRHIAMHATLTNLWAIPAIAIYVLALLEKRRVAYNGYMTWLQGFMSGLIITIIVTLLSPISQWITSTVITPYYFTNVIDYVVEHGQMTQEIAESQFNLGRYILMSAVGALIMGIITSAIVALFISRRKIS
jgi:hypothetical protein